MSDVESSKEQKPVILYALAGIAAFILFCVLVSYISRSVSTTSNTPAKASEVDAWYACQDFILEELKAPSTAEFQKRDSKKVYKETENIFIVSMYVDAENSFGAMVRTDFECRLRYTDAGQWLLLSLTTP